jgi:hypothetical protein
MDTIEQIKCLGAMDDWTQVDDHRRELRYKEYRVVDGKMWTAISSQMPDWLNSYDAIIPLIQKQFVIYDTKLNVHFDCYSATPSQLCEALLRAVGEWKD